MESEVAVGIVLTERPDLPELAPVRMPDAVRHAMLHELMHLKRRITRRSEAGRRGVRRTRTAPLAAAAPRITTKTRNTNTKTRKRDFSSSCPRIS
jgi:hypothetical protein